MKVLTFDVEEWFHLLHSKKGDWNNYPSRVEHGINKILDHLGMQNIKATFFCLGWVAEKYPRTIRRITDEGHEAGSHSHMHKSVATQSKKEFSDDLKRSIDCLQQIIGRKITSFRAPGFSININNLWVFEKLIENGIETDSSIITSNIHSHGGVRKLTISQPYLINVNGVSLKEFPINSKRLLMAKLIFSGGGYFRFFPYKMIKEWTGKSGYTMAYFHYRDFDAEQPVLEGINFIRRFQSYYGINSAYPKFQAYLNDFDFNSIEHISNNIDWKNAPKIILGEIKQQDKTRQVLKRRSVFTS